MNSDRRTFLKTAALAAPLAPALSANDRPAFGVIAAGGRGRYLANHFAKLGAQCVAVCDVREENLQASLKAFPDAKPYYHHEELLAQKGIDFTVCAGPDHWHCQHLLDSLKAGKDVYTEKPLSKSLQESAVMVQAVKNSGKIVQVGMQRRSAPSLIKAKQMVDSGLLGRITMVKAKWHWNVARPLNNEPFQGKVDWERFLGSAPKRPMEPRRLRYWRLFRDYSGGNMTDQGTHLMDVVQWFTGAPGPKAAIGMGYVAKNEGAEHPEVFSATIDHGKFLTTWELNYCNDFEDSWSILFMGDEATMRLDDNGVQVWKEQWKDNRTPIIDEKAPVPIETHIQNFLDCIKSRQQPNCTVEIAQRAVAGPHLANIAMSAGRQVRLAEDLVTVS
ncbi:MAG: Gfo/Idh/MocA family oxidoreductase [Candidatus Solibacter usitatus]|nr:Gfo/Idh/MocA family oxidoreductase [Candidatus Solibacter usitatus]